MQLNLDLGEYVRPKRIKLAPLDYSLYQNGNIVKLRLHNFVTYSVAEFVLSPSLNMIIGPNGSGKSTFVCAICLGLAGKPEFIGRTKNITNFIKNGADQATIEITLKDNNNSNNEITKISRIIYKDRKKSDYYIDDRLVTETAVKQYVKNFNIQLDNLCQFLSQEHVEEFARLKSDKLLEETIRSTDSSLLDYLNDLKLLQSNEVNSNNEIESKKKKLIELNKQKDKLDENVRSLKEFETKKNLLIKHQKLLPFAFLKDHKDKLTIYKNDYKKAKKQLQLLNKEKKNFQNQRELINTNEITAANLVDSTNSKIDSYKNKFKKTRSDLSNLREQILKQKRQIEYYQNRTVKIKENIKLANDQLIAKKTSLESIEIPDSQKFQTISDERNKIIEQQQSVKVAINDIKNKANSINHQITQIQTKIRQKQRSLTSNDKISLLDSGKRTDLTEIKKAVEYIRSKSSQDPSITNQILEPPIIAISAKAPAFGKYLAMAIPFRSSVALTVTSTQAYEKYSDEILSKFKVNLRELNNTELHQPIPRSELINKYGFEGYLSDFLIGDKRVVQMLCEIHKIHTIPVSRRELGKAQLEALMKPDENGRPLFNQILHGNNMVSINVSQRKQLYARSSNIDSPRNAYFYESSSMSEEMKEQINREISSMVNQTEEHKTTLEDLSTQQSDMIHKQKESEYIFNKLNAELYQLNEIRNNYSRMENDCKSLKEKLVKYKEEAKKDVSVKIKEVKQQISSELQDESTLLKRLIETVASIGTIEKTSITQQIELFRFKNLQISLNQLIESFNEREEILNNEYRTKKQSFEERKNSGDYAIWKQQIEDYSVEVKHNLSELAEEYNNEDKFTVAFIKEEIDKLESEISMMNHDASSIKILERVEMELKQLNETLPDQIKELNETRSNMKSKRDLLEPKLDDIVERISKKFAVLFTEVGSAGAIRLRKPDSFAEWEIEILVKFRDNAPLKKLDSHTQSGGERAVSTVLYMISLQELTTAPFRVVDEINQGMDRRNERIVHKAMVENACKENTSQYFLITPKLLTDLYYHEKMRIHCVMAGPWIPNPSKMPEMERFGETASYVL